MKEHADGVCLLCSNPKDLGEIACYIDRHGVYYPCVCDECLDKLITVENVMKFAAKPGCACDSDEERFKDSVWSALHTYDEIMELCRKDFEGRKESPVEWEQKEIKSRLKRYVERYYADDFVECVIPDIREQADELIEEMND